MLSKAIEVYSLSSVLFIFNAYDNVVCRKTATYFHSLVKKISSTQQLVLEWLFCCPEFIHGPCDILGYYFVWPFRLVAVSVCGRVGIWPFRSVAMSVCGRLGLWPFLSVTFSVCGRLGCGRFSVWSLWPVTVCFAVFLLWLGIHPLLSIYFRVISRTGQWHIFKVHISTSEKLCDGITKHIRIQCIDN